MDKLIKKNDLDSLLMDLEISSKKLNDILIPSQVYCLKYTNDSDSDNHYMKVDALDFEQKVSHITTIISQIKKLKKLDSNNNFEVVLFDQED